jgi:hypothetical protein
MGQPAKAFPQQNHDAHIAAHMGLLNTPPVQSNAQVQATIHAHVMEHLQMKADILALQQMPPELKAQYDSINQQLQQADPQQAMGLQAEAQNLLAQFSSPILAELVNDYTSRVGSPEDEDPLVSIRKQELALRGAELQQEQQQFALDQQRRSEEALRNDQIDREQIESREQIAKMKDDTTKQRMEIQKQLKIQDLINKYNK